jgi:signal transduction histidine kinase
MRERVAALGGEISTGPRTDGEGFRVRATLPVRYPAEEHLPDADARAADETNTT